jgi:hypothetical protein
MAQQWMWTLQLAQFFHERWVVGWADLQNRSTAKHKLKQLT